MTPSLCISLRCRCVLQGDEILSAVNLLQPVELCCWWLYTDEKCSTVAKCGICFGALSAGWIRSRCRTTRLCRGGTTRRLNTYHFKFLSRTLSGVLPGLCRVLAAALRRGFIQPLRWGWWSLARNCTELTNSEMTTPVHTCNRLRRISGVRRLVAEGHTDEVSEEFRIVLYLTGVCTRISGFRQIRQLCASRRRQLVTDWSDAEISKSDHPVRGIFSTIFEPPRGWTRKIDFSKKVGPQPYSDFAKIAIQNPEIQGSDLHNPRYEPSGGSWIPTGNPHEIYRDFRPKVSKTCSERAGVLIGTPEDLKWHENPV